MKEEMEMVVVCKHCGKHEYYGKMRWLSGWNGCRSCYKAKWEDENKKIYVWDDLDGQTPTEEEIELSRENNKELLNMMKN